MKYIITIFNTVTKTTHNINRDTYEEVEKVIIKELGGFENTRSAMTSGSNLHNDAYCQAGSTKCGTKMFSILAF